MKIGKTFIVHAPLESVWEFITCPSLVAPCIPGCSEAIQIDDTNFKAKVSLSIGPIKTTFSVDIEQLESVVPTFAKYAVKGNEGGQASRVKSESFLKLTPIDSNTTQVEYESDITIIGRLGKFGAGLVQKVADSIGNEFVTSLKGKIEGPRHSDDLGGLGPNAPLQEEASNTLDATGKNSWRWTVGYLVVLSAGIGAFAMVLRLFSDGS